MKYHLSPEGTGSCVPGSPSESRGRVGPLMLPEEDLRVAGNLDIESGAWGCKLQCGMLSSVWIPK